MPGSRSRRQTARPQTAAAAPASPAAPVPPVHRVAAHLARRFHQVCLGVLSEVTTPNGLSPLEFGALASIDERPGIDQRRLAARLAIDPVSAGQLSSVLEEKGLVERRIDPADRRARQLMLTRDGTRLRKRLRPLLQAAHDRILAPLTDADRTRLVDLLTRVVESNEPYARPGNGRRQPARRARGSTV